MRPEVPRCKVWDDPKPLVSGHSLRFLGEFWVVTPPWPCQVPVAALNNASNVLTFTLKMCFALIRRCTAAFADTRRRVLVKVTKSIPVLQAQISMANAPLEAISEHFEKEYI